MGIEIHTPELERRLRERVQSGGFHDVDELLNRALDALSEQEATGRAVFEHGLVLIGGPDDAALLDEIVRVAYEERRRPSKRRPVL
jgi:Arc/MetJ-type ribon-helix-helix transcriptional regulator